MATPTALDSQLAELAAIKDSVDFEAFCEAAFEIPSHEQILFAAHVRAKAAEVGVNTAFVEAFISAEICRRNTRFDGEPMPAQA